MSFLREYWLWIVIPFGLAILIFLLLIGMADTEEVSAFQYNVF